MKKYAELGTVHRTEPCEEYPGSWFLYFPSKSGTGKETSEALDSLESAIRKAEKILQAYEDAKLEYNPRDFTICWKCSDDDPRVGQVWFTGFYQHGRFNFYGEYKTT